jgi:hypothetical protein
MLCRNAAWCRLIENTLEGAEGNRFTYGRIFDICSRKNVKYGKSLLGISDVGTGAGE